MQTGKASSSSAAKASNILVREPHHKDILELSVTMRQEDKDEIWHLARISPGEALNAALEVCDYNRVVLLDGKVVCIFGIGGVKGEVGVPWMLASDLLKSIRKPFVRECRGYLEEMSQGYKLLLNVAWTKNEEHIKWLKWMGFDFAVPEPMGPDGEYYIRFSKVI